MKPKMSKIVGNLASLYFQRDSQKTLLATATPMFKFVNELVGSYAKSKLSACLLGSGKGGWVCAVAGAFLSPLLCLLWLLFLVVGGGCCYCVVVWWDFIF